MNSFDRRVAARHHIVLRMVRIEARPNGRIILARNNCVPRGRQVRQDPAQQLALPDAFQLHQSLSIVRRRRAANSGSGASAMARMTQALCNPSAFSCPMFEALMPPIAKTGTPGSTAAAIAAMPLGPITCFSALIGVANAGPQPR